MPRPGTVGSDAQKKTLLARDRAADERAAWRGAVAARDPATLGCLDETRTPTRLTPLRARAPRGVRAVGRVPRGRWTTVTLRATRTPAGIGPAGLVAGATDRPVFEASIEQLLVPALRPGQVVALDTRSVHTAARARALIAAAGCRVRFRPRSSPDVTPIAPAFAQITQARRRAEARTFDALVTAAGPALAAVTAAAARACFTAAGLQITAQLL